MPSRDMEKTFIANMHRRLFGKQSDIGDSLDALKVRVRAEEERQARLKSAGVGKVSKGVARRLDAFLPVREGEPGSNAVPAARARRRALRRLQHRQPKHGRQYVTTRH